MPDPRIAEPAPFADTVQPVLTVQALDNGHTHSAQREQATQTTCSADNQHCIHRTFIQVITHHNPLSGGPFRQLLPE
jgi:hypothetical protein